MTRILCAATIVTTVTSLLVSQPVKADPAIDFFGDVGYQVQHDAATTNTFRAASLDIFATQTEGKFTFVGELIVEAFGSNDFTIDADRLEVSYKPRPWLRLRIGRIRTAFGFYGDAYQNGKFFFIPISWPSVYEGDGVDGIVPSHSIGAHVDVVRELGGQNGKVSIDAEVLNGRGATTSDVTAYTDNNSKAVNIRLRYLGQDVLEGLTIGANVYVDDLPVNGSVSPLRTVAMHELIVAGHVAYVARHVHVVSEAMMFRHREHVTRADYETYAGFVEAAYEVEDVTPYARFQYTRYDDPDPYFLASGIAAVNEHLLSVGAKYAASASVAVKLEGQADVVRHSTGVAVQAAFAF